MSEAFRLGRADGELVTRAAFIAEGRSWRDVKFEHQHSDKLAGCDCIGFLRGIARGVGLVNVDSLPTLPAAMFAYGPRPDGVSLKRWCDEHLKPIPIAFARAADVVLLRFRRHPQHLALLVDHPGGLGMIHALGPGGPGKVVEHGFDDEWRQRVVAAYSVPGVEA